MFKYLSFNEFINEIEIKKAEPLSKDEEGIFKELVSYRKAYAKSQGKEFDASNLEHTKEELTKLLSFVKSKADPTTGKSDAGAKRVLAKIEKDADSSDSSDSADSKKSKASSDKKQQAKEKKQRDKEKKQRDEDIEKEFEDQETSKKTEKSLAKAGLKVTGDALVSAVKVLASILGIDEPVKGFIDDINSNIDKVKDAINTAKEEKQKVKDTMKQQLKDENENYSQALEKLHNAKDKAKDDEERKKIKQLIDDVEKQHSENNDTIRNNADKKIEQYNKILDNLDDLDDDS